MNGEDGLRALWPRRLCTIADESVLLDDSDIFFLRKLKISTADLPQYTITLLSDQQLAMMQRSSLPLQCAMLWGAVRKHEQQCELLDPQSYEQALDHVYAHLRERDDPRRTTVECEYNWLHSQAPLFVPPRRVESLYQTLCPQQYLRGIGVTL